jgi:hypothetical protein
VCRIFYFHIFLCTEQTNNKERASRQTHARKQQQKTKENSTGTKHKWKRAECDYVKQGKKNSEEESFKCMKIKYPTHMKMAM